MYAYNAMLSDDNLSDLHICRIEYGSKNECVTVQVGFHRESGMTDCKSEKLKQCYRFLRRMFINDGKMPEEITEKHCMLNTV